MHLPFGGTKDTGNGHREAGQAALDVFTEWKSIYVDYSGRLQRAQIDNVEHPRPERWVDPAVEPSHKLVWFVPESALDATRDAVFAAGAGRIGAYERCSWYAAGTGTFQGGEGTAPARRRGRTGGARARAARRDRRARRRAGRGRRRAARCASVRGAGLRPLPARVKARLFTDGGARGNPGPAAYAYVLEAEDGTVLDARGEAIGVATNNVAEYRALAGRPRAGAVEVGVDELEVVSDSELMVKQMRGEYRVKNEALRGLSVEAGRLARQVGTVDVHGRAPRAQRARRPPRQRGARRRRLTRRATLCAV